MCIWDGYSGNCGARGTWFLVSSSGEASGIQIHISYSITGQTMMGWHFSTEGPLVGLIIVPEFVAQESGSHVCLENTVSPH